MKSISARDILCLVWTLVVLPSVILSHWTADNTIRILGELAAGAVVPILVPKDARIAVTAIVGSLLGTSIFIWTLGRSISAGARATVGSLCAALLVYGIMRGRGPSARKA